MISAINRPNKGKENIFTEKYLKRRNRESSVEPKNNKIKRVQSNLQPIVIHHTNQRTSKTIKEPRSGENGHAAFEIIVKKIILETEGLREATEQCSEFATYLQVNPRSENLLKSECQTFEIYYRELVVPTPGQWVSKIGFLKSVLDLKIAIFFAGEKDEEFECKAPSVEQIQLLENAVPILQKMASWSETENKDLIGELEKMTNDISLSAVSESIAKLVLKEIKLFFPQKSFSVECC